MSSISTLLTPLNINNIGLVYSSFSLLCNTTIKAVNMVISNKIYGFGETEDIIIYSDIIVKIDQLNKYILTVQNKLIEQHMEYLTDIINTLMTLLESISKMKEYQSTLYFNSWRFRLPDLTPVNNDLKKGIHIFNERYKNFIDMLQIITYTHILSIKT
jgi:hypothetical protein